jgi:hypothetical protein
VFHARDLPEERATRDKIFLAAMGSPDRYGRQLNGMGGGVSSLSKACIVGPPSVAGADVDYTFVQVQVGETRCDYSGNCGNMCSAIGPFAVDEGLVDAPAGREALVRIYNTNTAKVIHSTFPVQEGHSLETGALAIPGVDGVGAPIRLDFLDPGGASTGRLLPTGRVLDTLESPTGSVRVSMVDAANACVFVDAADFGLAGVELPDALEANTAVMDALAEVRLNASVAMGLAASQEQARAIAMIPFIAIVSAPQDSLTLDGETVAADQADLVVRILSNGRPHRALPLTGALCTAVAAQLADSVPSQHLRAAHTGAIRLSMPSGVLTVDARVRRDRDEWRADYGSFYRTTRRLFDGFVYA